MKITHTGATATTTGNNNTFITHTYTYMLEKNELHASNKTNNSIDTQIEGNKTIPLMKSTK